MGEVMLETFIRFNTEEVFRGVLLIFLADCTFLVELAPVGNPTKNCFGQKCFFFRLCRFNLEFFLMIKIESEINKLKAMYVDMKM